MEQSPDDATIPGQQDRMRAGRLALVVGVLIFAAKLAAFLTTHSTAVLADAMESTINIVAAALLVYALSLASRPPDPGHPYGHGKIEFLSAGIEGAAIAFAALVIVAEGIRDLIAGPEIRSLDVGLALLVASTVANAALGFHLVRVGRRADSAALEADGRLCWPTSGRASACWSDSAWWPRRAGSGRIPSSRSWSACVAFEATRS
ncbi:MAG: cation diffusion facilitator family transporter [Myxococcota bacterium]